MAKSQFYFNAYKMNIKFCLTDFALAYPCYTKNINRYQEVFKITNNDDLFTQLEKTIKEENDPFIVYMIYFVFKQIATDADKIVK